jgi:hypothetical protein
MMQAAGAVREESLLSLAVAVTYSSPVNAFTVKFVLAFIQGGFIFVTVVVPLVLSITLLILWLIPLRLWLQRRLLGFARLLHA